MVKKVKFKGTSFAFGANAKPKKAKSKGAKSGRRISAAQAGSIKWRGSSAPIPY